MLRQNKKWIRGTTSSYFYLMSMATSFLNFLYYPALSRLLPVDQYGEVQFIVTILFQISVLFLALNIVTILISLKYSHEPSVLTKKILALSSALNALTITITVALILVLGIFHQEFGFNNPIAIVAMGLAIISTVPFTLGVGLFQGRNLYIKAGSLNVLGSGLKLLISILLVLGGLGTTGAILGIALGQLGAVLLFTISGKDRLVFSDVFSLSSVGWHTLKDDRLLLSSCAWIIMVNILMSLDTIIAKASLVPDEAGEYAGVATLSKIAIFAVSPLMWLVIPRAVNYNKDKKTVYRLLTIATLFCTLLIGSYVILGRFIIEIIVGARYLVMSDLLVIATIGASLLSLAAMAGVILIARQAYRHAAWQACAITIGFLAAAVSSLYSNNGVILSILIGQAVGGGVGVVYYSIIRHIK